MLVWAFNNVGRNTQLLISLFNFAEALNCIFLISLDLILFYDCIIDRLGLYGVSKAAIECIKDGSELTNKSTLGGWISQRQKGRPPGY